MATQLNPYAVGQTIAKLGQRRAGTESEKKDTSSKTDWFELGLEAQDARRKIIESLDTTQLKRAKQSLDYAAKLSRIDADLLKAQMSSDVAALNAQKDLVLKRLDLQKDYNAKTRVADAKITGVIKETLRKKGNQDPIVQVFDAYSKPFIGEGLAQRPNISLNDPAWESTFVEMLDMLNKDNGQRETAVEDAGTLFYFNADRTVDWERSKNKIQSADGRRELDASQLRKIEDLVETYNRKRTQSMTLEANLQSYAEVFDREYEQALAAAQGGRVDEAKNIAEKMKESGQKLKAAGDTYSGTMSKSEADAIVADADYRRKMADDATEYVEYAKRKLTGEQQEQENAGIIYGVANPVFRAWAADHGFDNIGEVEVDDKGKPKFGTYRAGGDDIAAILAYKNQSLRKPGNYGLRGLKVDTGEIWRVELKNGEVVTGARLKRHAADPFGAIRIVTEDGAMVITPEDASRSQILRRPKQDLSRIDRRAKRIYEREKGLYGRLEDRAAFEAGFPDEEDLALSEDRQYLTKDGKYVRKDEMLAARDRAQKDVVYAQEYDGNNYLVSGASGDVYGVTDDGVVYKVDKEKNKALYEGVLGSMPAVNERNLVGRQAAKGEARPSLNDATLLSAQDLESAVGQSVENIPGLSVTDDTDRAQYAALVPQLASNQLLGYSTTDKAPLPTVTGDYRNEAGFQVIDAPVGEGPDIPEFEEDVLGTRGLEAEEVDLALDMVGEERTPTGGPGAVAGSGDAARMAAATTPPPPKVEEETVEEETVKEVVTAPTSDKKEKDAGPRVDPKLLPGVFRSADKGVADVAATSGQTTPMEDRRALAGKETSTTLSNGAFTDAGAMTMGGSLGDAPTEVKKRKGGDLDLDGSNDIDVPPLLAALGGLLKRRDKNKLPKRRKKKNQSDTAVVGNVEDDSKVPSLDVPTGNTGPIFNWDQTIRTTTEEKDED